MADVPQPLKICRLVAIFNWDDWCFRGCAIGRCYGVGFLLFALCLFVVWRLGPCHVVTVDVVFDPGLGCLNSNVQQCVVGIL